MQFPSSGLMSSGVSEAHVPFAVGGEPEVGPSLDEIQAQTGKREVRRNDVNPSTIYVTYSRKKAEIKH
jgi:hypothetical protein